MLSAGVIVPNARLREVRTLLHAAVDLRPPDITLSQWSCSWHLHDRCVAFNELSNLVFRWNLFHHIGRSMCWCATVVRLSSVRPVKL